MLKILPYESFILKTHLSNQEVVDRLKTHTEARQSFRITPSHQEFEGEIDGSSFALNRVVHFSKSLYPVAEGDIESSGCGAIVKIRMRLNMLSLLFAMVLFGGISFTVIAELTQNGIKAVSQIGGPFIVLIALGAFLNWNYWPEAKIIRKKINDILSADINSDTECLSCGKLLPVRSDKCPHCGWTYKAN